MPKVCIDAGHYGNYNQSPGVPEYYESKVMWKLHLLQKKHLEALGIEVVTTRKTQSKDLDLHLRGKAAKGCDLFISNHSNAVGSKMKEGVDRVEVYHLVDDTTTSADEISKQLAAKLAPLISDIMNVKQAPKVLSRKSGNDRNGDGLDNDNYYGVLHGARLVNVPGLLIEHSFHTDTKAAKWLLSDNNLNTLAKAEAECIAAFLKGTATQSKPASKPATAKPNSYIARITADALNVRSGPGISYKINAVVKKGEAYTIVLERNGWGKLKSGAGWISLKYTEKV